MKTKRIALQKKSSAPPIIYRTAQIFSRHPSHNGLRRQIRTGGKKVLIRFGSSTVANNKYTLELNKIEAIHNSSNKFKMKNSFKAKNVKTAIWFTTSNGKIFTEELTGVSIDINNLNYPIIMKHIFGSRGRGNTKIDTAEQLAKALIGKQFSNYIFEKFYNYNKEYRLHVTKNKCFYTCRKMLKNETAKEKRWFRNDSNSVWIVEDNPIFDKPSNWKSIEEESIKALISCGLDFGAVDVRVQSKKKEADFIIIEINSAPGLGIVGIDIYKKELLNLINEPI